MHIGLEVENKMIKMIQQKKNDTTAMATAINEIYIEWWHGNCFLVGDKTLVGRGVNFCGGEGEEVLWK